MPSTRRTRRHVEAVEAHGETVTRFTQEFTVIVADGAVDEHEIRRLVELQRAVIATFAPLPTEAHGIDVGVRMIGTLANTLSPTDWVNRLMREAAEDERRLNERADLAAVASRAA